MRKALVVGINHYAHRSGLFGCVNDAYAVASVLERHSDGTVNFDVIQLTASSAKEAISRSRLRDGIKNLFEGDHIETALLYFAGHGSVDAAGGYILASDSTKGDDGISLNDVLGYANESSARNKIIILDSCKSGVAGIRTGQHADLSDGLTILTAATADQYATEENGRGIFTTLLVDAMNGAASNLVGDVTPGGVYAHIDQSLGSWEQRPVFKTNVKSFVSLRKVQPPIDLGELRRIDELFPSEGFEFMLDPSFEPTSENPNPENTERFAVLQKYARVNLVVPIGAPHMYYAAMEKKSCKLTVLGEHYRRLRVKKRI